jgi:hypothetical protein
VKVRAHTFAFITPAMTDRYKIPNPCTTCHTDKSTAWAAEALRSWPERSPWRLGKAKGKCGYNVYTQNPLSKEIARLGSGTSDRKTARGRLLTADGHMMKQMGRSLVRCGVRVCSRGVVGRAPARRSAAPIEDVAIGLGYTVIAQTDDD